MPLLLGDKNTEDAHLDHGNIDFNALFHDNERRYFNIHLVGVRKYGRRAHKFGTKPISEARSVSPLELSLLISSSKGVTNSRVEPDYYVESRPYDILLKTLDNAVVNFENFQGLHYGVMGPSLESEIEGIGKGRPKSVIKLSRDYLLPSTSEEPFFSNVISREDMWSLVNKFPDRPKRQISRAEYEDYISKWSKASFEFNKAILNLFSSDNILSYKNINRKLVLPEHKEHPIFSLGGKGFTGKNDEDKYFTNSFKKMGIFLFGTDRVIRDNLIGHDQWAFHFAECLGSFIV